MTFWDSLDVLQKISNVLIISLVAINAILGILTWQIQSRITHLSNKKDKVLESKVDFSNKNAVEFESKASELETRLKESEQLRVAAEERLKNSLESTDKQLSITQQQIASRSIPEDQKKSLINFLRSNPKDVVEIETPYDDSEAGSFAKEISDLLLESGWRLSNFARSMFPTNFNPKNIIISYFSKQQESSAKNIVYLLNVLNFPFELKYLEDSSPRTIHILVGKKQ